MKLLFFINLIFTFLFLHEAAVSRGVHKDPDHPGKCVINDIIMSPGEIVLNPFNKCRRMICGANSWVVIHTCGAILPPKGYKLGEPLDATAPYPKCCERHYISIEERDVQDIENDLHKL
ncbi:uncharacterized protein ACRADG_006721 isoform 1-T1 [Cochliomyia hominivorax]